MPVSKIPGESRAIFDVKPVDESGSLDFQRINSVRPTVNLASFRPKKLRQQKKTPIFNNPIEKADVEILPRLDYPPAVEMPTQQSLKEQFNELMNRDLDLGIELAKIGGKTASQTNAKPRYRVIQSSSSAVFNRSEPNPAPEAYDLLASEIHRSAIAAAREPAPDRKLQPSTEELKPSPIVYQMNPVLEDNVRSFYQSPAVELIARPSPRPGSRRQPVKIRKGLLIGVIAILVLIGLAAAYGFYIKEQVIEESAAAVANLQTAQEDLKALDFKNASEDFFSAYTNFFQAGDRLNVFGANLTGMIANLPGAGSLKSANNLIRVGQLLSGAGTSITTALNSVSQTGALADPASPNIPIGAIAAALKKALLSAQGQVLQASALMADIDSSIIPGDKKPGFDELKSKLPDLEMAINMSTDYSKFFENLVGSAGVKRYLIMFQNASELRQTGGFPGTYGVMTFKNGKLDNIFIDDVYNLDGQLKEKIIPPLQLQHITPTWGMRDANWYVDFPTSARNIAAFYDKARSNGNSIGRESGQGIDGVMVLNPEVIPEILKIVGPIQMSQYGLTLTAENVLTTIQDQVEYGPNRTQPKQIVKDFGPILLSKIYSAGSDKWLSIFNTLVLNINRRNVLMYFNDLSLQSFVTDKGFSGRIHPTGKGEDYLMVTLSNIKGSKTDAVTETSFNLETAFAGNSAAHTLAVTRKHNGGNTKFGFYNKQNPAYVRVLVPQDAEFVSIEDNDKPNFGALINYTKDSSFIRDEMLTKFETGGVTNKETGVTTYSESGKKEFGFWLIIDPGKSKTVTIRYKVPDVTGNSSSPERGSAESGKTYRLYVQKQPALKVKSFDFSIEKSNDFIPSASAPLLTRGDNGNYSYSGSLEGDLAIKINFK